VLVLRRRFVGRGEDQIEEPMQRAVVRGRHEDVREVERVARALPELEALVVVPPQDDVDLLLGAALRRQEIAPSLFLGLNDPDEEEPRAVDSSQSQDFGGMFQRAQHVRNPLAGFRLSRAIPRARKKDRSCRCKREDVAPSLPSLVSRVHEMGQPLILRAPRWCFGLGGQLTGEAAAANDVGRVVELAKRALQSRGELVEVRAGGGYEAEHQLSIGVGRKRAVAQAP
jgi:hypothetical protein